VGTSKLSYNKQVFTIGSGAIRRGFDHEAGYTLIEVVVVLVVIGVLSAITARAYPAARSNQSLSLAEQQLQSAFRDAQELAINESRSTECREAAADAGRLPDDQRQCSDIGIFVSGNELLWFADTDLGPDDTLGGDKQYTDGVDMILKRLPLPSGVSVVAGGGSNTSFLFEGIPPSVNLRVDGVPFTVPGLVVLAADDAEVRLEVRSHGQVSRIAN